MNLISYITLVVQDPDRSRRFYSQVFGLEGRTSASSVVTIFDLGSLRLALCPPQTLVAEMAGGDGPRSAQVEAVLSNARAIVAHNVERLQDVTLVYGRALAAGAQELSPPSPKAWGGTSAFFSDPDGHIWEVVWNPKGVA